MFNRFYTFVLVCFMVMLMPLIAFAQEAAKVAEDAGIDSWVFQIVSYLIAAAASIASVAVPILLKHYLKKSKYTAALAEDARLDFYIEKGINWSEEKARTAVKQKLNKPTSNEKLDMAAEFVIGQLESREVAAKGTKRIKNLIEAKLGEKSDSVTSKRDGTA